MAPPTATREANTIRPGRELGVVRGSEIMKKAKRRSDPDWSPWRGMVQGSPRIAARPNTMSAWAARKA
jgi:hypothetical protein